MVNKDVTFGSNNFGIGDEFALIVVDHEAICTLDKTKVFGTLKNEGHRVFQIKDMRSVPIGNVVNIALVGSRDNQIIISDRHVYHSILEV